MKIESFSFYKKLKDEDADPFIKINNDSGLLVAADGLGGSGSFVHIISDKDKKELPKIQKVILNEYNEDKFNDEDFDNWVDSLIQTMRDDNPDTSALWGSRVVISRFVYYVLKNDVDFSNEKDRQDIIDFIYKGMENTVRKFDLKPGAIQGQLTLPTTLVSAKYFINADNTIKVDVIWAGDSRAYAFIPNEGLKQLSQDDEDASGAINNLFCISHERPFNTNLHYATYVLPEKSMLFVCSDGFFDPFAPIDNIGVEKVFLDSMERAESFVALSSNWLEFYQNTRHDDCSVAFVAFGFESFEELKRVYSNRVKIVSDAYDNYYANRKYIPIAMGEDEDPKKYVIERISNRKQQIASKIAGEIIANSDSSDATVLSEFKKAYIDLEKEQDGIVNSYKESLIGYLKEYPERVNDAFKAQKLDDQNVKNIISKAERLFDIQNKGVERQNKVNNANETAEEKFKKTLSKCFDKLEAYVSSLMQKSSNYCTKNEEKMNRKVDEMADKVKSHCTQYMKAHKDPNKANGIAQTNNEQARKQYDNAIDKNITIDIVKNASDYFSDDVLQSLQLNNLDRLKGIDEETLSQKIFDILEANENAIVDRLIDALVNCDASVIDGTFNPSRLKLSREYRDFKVEDIEKIKAVKESVDALTNAYENLTSISPRA